MVGEWIIGGALVVAALGAPVVWIVFVRRAARRITAQARREAARDLEDAEREATAKLREAELQAKEKLLQARSEFELAANEERRKLETVERRLQRDREEQVGCLHRDLELVKVVVLQQLDMVHRRFDQRVGARLAIFFEQMLFEATAIHADADRAAIGLRRADDFGNALVRPDIARIDPQARSPRIGGFQCALVMEMDVGDDRHARGAGDQLEGGGAFDVGAGAAPGYSRSGSGRCR